MNGQYAAYVSATFLLAVTPGATTAVVVRNALAAGRRAGYTAAAGAVLANTIQATIAGVGVALLLGQSQQILNVLRIAGAVYLSWLGLQSLWRVVRRPALSGPSIAGPKGPAHNNSAFRQGLVTNLLNPPIATFYWTVVPAFIPAGTHSYALTFAGLALTHIAIAFVCHAGWATAFDRLKALIARRGFSIALDVLTGVALLGLAARSIWR
jgi:threonine/homoserine/homoserine lactone efflux protein